MSITIVNRRDIIRGVRDKWADQYKHYPDETRVDWGGRLTAGEIRQRLAALDLETCSPADVDFALQVERWAALECDECGADVETLLRIGDEPDYDARWVDLCSACLAAAASKLPA